MSPGGDQPEARSTMGGDGPVQVSSLFNVSWVREGSSEFLQFLWLILYAPLGLCLFLVRLFILLQFLLLRLLLPDSKLKQKGLRVMSAILGVTVSAEGEVGSRTFVANHVTRLDHFVVSLITNALLAIVEEDTVQGFLLGPLGIFEGVRKEDLPNTPLLFLPEKETTNGQAGLLQFTPMDVLEGVTVQPIALKVTRPLLNVNSINAGLRAEILFTLFLPYTHYSLRLLPLETWDPVETQKVIARALDLQPTKYTVGDKAEFIKKTNFRPPSVASMARLVQQQLHPVILSPESVLAALQKTGSVAGAVEELRKSITEPSFRKNASDRMMSFQERKRIMILTARKKYCEKHGLEF